MGQQRMSCQKMRFKNPSKKIIIEERIKKAEKMGLFENSWNMTKLPSQKQLSSRDPENRKLHSSSLPNLALEKVVKLEKYCKRKSTSRISKS